MEIRNKYGLCSAHVACIDKLLTELSTTADELEREISFEETRTGITDPQHFAYPIYARAAMLRRDNLRSSVEELKARLA